MVNSRQLRNSVTTMNKGLVKCRVNLSSEAIVFTSSCLIDFDFNVEGKGAKRQSRKSMALPSIRRENEAQMKAKVERETSCFSIRI